MPELTAAARVAALKILAERVASEYEAARRDAEPEFARLRAQLGVKSLDVLLPGGASAGTISIRAGARIVEWDEAALVDYAETAAPHEVVEAVDPAALDDEEVRALIAAHRPDLVRRTVRPAYRAALDKQLSADGTVVDPRTGEVVALAEVTTTAPSGRFSYTRAADAEQAVLDAWHAGALAEVGASLVPAELEPAEPESAPAGPFPQGGAS
ncbi:hypothetical protein J0910_00535 [Nocardiopsis sp. CNT-189]|uniref:hypothetical protein n=1 Tax=Nocardiopsis oceanisediminis TaxID=2816862 RepID=UPI003B32787D